MRPIAYISTSGNLYYEKSAAGPNAIPLIPMPLPLTNARILSTLRGIGRRSPSDKIDWSLIRAIERAHGIYDPEDME